MSAGRKFDRIADVENKFSKMEARIPGMAKQQLYLWIGNTISGNSLYYSTEKKLVQIFLHG